MPLYGRAEKISNPAKKMAAGLRGGESMEKYILEYAAPYANGGNDVLH